MLKRNKKQSELAKRFIALHSQYDFKFWPIGEKAFANYRSNDMYDLRQQRLQRLEENATAPCSAEGIERIYKTVVKFHDNYWWEYPMSTQEYKEIYNKAKEATIEEIATILGIDKSQPLEGLPDKVKRVLEINNLVVEIIERTEPKEEEGYPEGYPIYKLYFSGYNPMRLY